MQQDDSCLVAISTNVDEKNKKEEKKMIEKKNKLEEELEAEKQELIKEMRRIAES